MIKKPMLAGRVTDIDKIKYPILCTPKLDGIRALMVNGKLLSRKFLPIPNVYIRQILEELLPDGVDGELMLNGGEFNDTSSAIMSEDGEPDFIYCIFDYVKDDPSVGYYKRVQDMEDELNIYSDFTELVLPYHINNKEMLLEYETSCLENRYEGVIIRSIDGPYKFGRSTEKEGYLLKLKRFVDREARVIDFKERMHNANAAEEDAFGHTKRSQALSGMVPDGTLGKLVVKDSKFEEEFDVGTGFTDEERQEIWNNKPNHLGRMIKYKYQECGTVDKPRFPVFLGWRDERDM